MKKEKQKIEPIDPIEFFSEKTGEYLFPFKVLDEKYGQIQWFIEIHPAHKDKEGMRRIKEIWVWARQTQDPRYLNKIFKVETHTECLTTDASLRRHTAFVPWRIIFCEMHKCSVILDAYPENDHKALRIQAGSSISVEANFIN